jgi:hypothetical protein
LYSIIYCEFSDISDVHEMLYYIFDVKIIILDLHHDTSADTIFFENVHCSWSHVRNHQMRPFGDGDVSLSHAEKLLVESTSTGM